MAWSKGPNPANQGELKQMQPNKDTLSSLRVFNSEKAQTGVVVCQDEHAVL